MHEFQIFVERLGSEVGRFGEDEGREYEGKARAAKGGVGCLGVEGSRGAKIVGPWRKSFQGPTKFLIPLFRVPFDIISGKNGTAANEKPFRY